MTYSQAQCLKQCWQLLFTLLHQIVQRLDIQHGGSGWKQKGGRSNKTKTFVRQDGLKQKIAFNQYFNTKSSCVHCNNYSLKVYTLATKFNLPIQEAPTVLDVNQVNRVRYRYNKLWAGKLCIYVCLLIFFYFGMSLKHFFTLWAQVLPASFRTFCCEHQWNDSALSTSYSALRGGEDHQTCLIG